MDKIKLGAVIYAPKVTVIWGIIQDFFASEHCPIEPVFYKDYKSQVDALMKGEIDIAWNSPLAWLDAFLLSKGECLNGSMRDTDQNRKSYLVVRKEDYCRSEREDHRFRCLRLSAGQVDSDLSFA